MKMMTLTRRKMMLRLIISSMVRYCLFGITLNAGKEDDNTDDELGWPPATSAGGSSTAAAFTEGSLAVAGASLSQVGEKAGSSSGRIRSNGSWIRSNSGGNT